MLFFAHKKNGDMSKIKGVVVLKGIFSKIAYVCILTYQITYQVSSIILTSFTQGKRTPKKPSLIRVNPANISTLFQGCL